MSTKNSAAAVAHPNIALIKYWGNRDHALRLPANGSLSMNLAGLETRTTVRFSSELSADELTLNGGPVSGPGLARVSQMLDRVRVQAGINDYAQVTSENNFPTGSGIASSASAFAALALAASAAAGLALPETELSALARTGSGSASRSVPGGFVEWLPGEDHASSYAHSIASPEHWALADCVAIVSREHKATGSTGGHAVADSSPLQSTRVADTPRRLDRCRAAVLEKDFRSLAEVVEQDSNMMHAVMMTSEPRLLYWLPGTVAVMAAVESWRREGLPACYTIDAGPNVHVLTPTEQAGEVTERLRKIPGVLAVLQASPGGPARLVEQG
jgi:diphosphomevalonate decarboxylase